MVAPTHKRIAKNTLLLYLRTAIGLIVSLYTSRVILRVLGAEDYGIYSVVGDIVMLFAFLNVGMWEAIIRYFSYELGREDKARLAATFSTAVNIFIVLWSIVFLLAETVGLWFLNYKMNIPADRMYAANWVYQCSIVTFLVNLLSIPYNASIIAHEQMKAFAYISILEVSLKLLIVFMLLWLGGDKLIIYALLMLGVTVSIFLLYRAYCRRHFGECRYRLGIDRALFREMFGFVGWNFVGNMGNSIRFYGTNILLNLFFGPTVNAAQAIANQVNTAVFSFVSNFQMAIKPQITKQYAAGDMAETVSLIYRCARYSFFLMMIMVVPVLTNTDYLLRLWLQNAPAHTAAFLRLTLIATLLVSMWGGLATVVQATGRIRLFQICISSLMLMNLPVSYIALCIWDQPTAVFYIAIAIEVVSLVTRAILANRQVNIRLARYLLTVVGRNVLLFVPAIVVAHLTSEWLPDNFTGFILSCLISATWSLLIILGLGLTRAERTFIAAKIGQKLTFRNNQPS